MEDSAYRFLRESHIRAEWLLAVFRVALPALLTLPALDIVPPSSGSYRFDFARMTRHLEPCFLQAKSSR